MKFNPVREAKSFWYYNSTSQTSIPSSLGLDSKPFEVNRKASPDCSNFGSGPKPCFYTFHSPSCLHTLPNLGTSVHVSWLRAASGLLYITLANIISQRTNWRGYSINLLYLLLFCISIMASEEWLAWNS